jgi:hypothetical protein
LSRRQVLRYAGAAGAIVAGGAALSAIGPAGASPALKAPQRIPLCSRRTS